MRVLSVCQPWANEIVSGAKPVEYRSWPTNYRGLIAIHASLSKQHLPKRKKGGEGKQAGAFVLGKIVGVVELVNVVKNDEHGDYEWRLAKPVKFGEGREIDWKGRVSLTKLDDETLGKVIAELKASGRSGGA